MKLYRMLMGGLWIKFEDRGWQPARRIEIAGDPDFIVTPEFSYLHMNNIGIQKIEEYKWKL